MHRMIFVAGFSAAVALASAAAAAPAPPSTLTGVYTAAQAAAGKTVYDGACAMCHGPNLRGSFEAPPLTGRLIANWAGGSVGALHSYTQKAMPLFAPGSLSPEVTSNIVAYILQNAGYPAGATPLPSGSAALAAIRFAPLTPTRLIQTNSTGAAK